MSCCKAQGGGDLKRIETPLDSETVFSLRIGDRVLLSGFIYTARDAAHRRFIEELERSGDLPIEIEGQVIYYVGPTPPRPGMVVGSAGPTTSYRMDPYTPRLVSMGLKGMIGKGPRGEDVKKAMARFGAVYFAATGGCGALISKCIKSSEIVLYEDLGPEAVRRLYVEDLPLTVAVDAFFGDIYQEAKRRWKIER